MSKKTLSQKIVESVVCACSLDTLCAKFHEVDRKKICRVLLQLRSDGNLTVFVARDGQPASVAPKNETQQKVFALVMRDLENARLLEEKIKRLECDINHYRDLLKDMRERARTLIEVGVPMPPGLQPMPEEVLV